MYSFEVAIIGLYFFMRTPSMRFYNKKLLDKFLGGVYFFLLLFLMESVRRTLPEMASKFFFTSSRCEFPYQTAAFNFFKKRHKKSNRMLKQFS